MYSNLHFAITLLGIFSIFEIFKGGQKLSVLKYHILARLLMIVAGSFFDYLALDGYEIPYYHEIFRLIAATSNLSFGGTTGFTWGPTANYVMAIRNGINAGMSNTERIIIKQGAGIGNYAAMVAAHYSFNGNGWGDYGDWYLPSLYELQLLFKQKNDKRLNFTNTTYVWSSTEADDKTAYTLNFFSTGGTVQAEPKNLNPRSVRAIRAF